MLRLRAGRDQLPEKIRRLALNNKLRDSQTIISLATDMIRSRRVGLTSAPTFLKRGLSQTMKKLLLTTALCALASPAFASFVQLNNVEDGDEISAFIYDGDNTKDSFLSLTGNGASKTQDISVHTDVNSHFSNGDATIKPDSGHLESILFTPLAGFNEDGFFAHVQLEYFGSLGGSNKPKTGTFWMDVNGGSGVAGGFTFAFTDKLNANVGPYGFDEPGDKTTESLIKSIRLYTDGVGDFAFKEAKQFDFSGCAVDGSCFGSPGTTGSPVPEPSTWAMMIVGFAGLGYAAFRSGRKESLSRRYERHLRETH
jgi:hypothetical protein